MLEVNILVSHIVNYCQQELKADSKNARVSGIAQSLLPKLKREPLNEDVLVQKIVAEINKKGLGNVSFIEKIGVLYQDIMPNFKLKAEEELYRHYNAAINGVSLVDRDIKNGLIENPARLNALTVPHRIEILENLSKVMGYSKFMIKNFGGILDVLEPPLDDKVKLDILKKFLKQDPLFTLQNIENFHLKLAQAFQFWKDAAESYPEEVYEAMDHFHFTSKQENDILSILRSKSR